MIKLSPGIKINPNGLSWCVWIQEEDKISKDWVEIHTNTKGTPCGVSIYIEYE